MDITRIPARRFVTVGAIAVGLCIAGTGVATAAAPTSALSRSVTELLQSAGVDWSSMPDGYTPEQYQAFWGAGYTAENVGELGALWNLDSTETKARAGQLLLDGQPVPVAPGGESSPIVEITGAQVDALFGAGYTGEDVEALAELWNTEFGETKARAGQMILDGQTPPVAPSGTPDSQS